MTSGRPEQIVGLECACCRQMYHPGQALNDAFDTQVLGAEKYVVCAVCGLNVPDSMRDSSYKKRWRRARTVDLRIEELRLLVSLSLLTSMESSVEADRLFNLVLRRLQGRYPDKTLLELKVAGDRLCKSLQRP
jgi:hypothetical protein